MTGSTSVAETASTPARQRSSARVWGALKASPWLSVVSVGTVAILWELVGRTGRFRVVPPISEIWSTWLELFRRGDFSVVWVSLQTFSVGILLAIGVALIVAVITTISRIADYVLKPYIDVMMSIPITAIIPILMVVFGLGQETRVAVVFLYAVFIIVINMQSGIRSVDPSHIEMARAFAAPQSVIIRKIVLRSAVPMVVTGIRLGIMRGLKGMINAEVIIGTAGIGYLLMREGHSFNIAGVFAVTGTIIAMALTLLLVLSGLERLALRRQLRT